MPSLWQRLIASTWQVKATPEWDELGDSCAPAKIMHWPPGQRHHAKQGRSIGRFEVAAEGRKCAFFLKRQHRLPRWLGWFASLMPSRGFSPPLKEFENIRVAGRLGIAVPKVLAAGEAVGPWGRLQGFLAIEELSGMLALHEAIPLAAKSMSAVAFCRWKTGLVDEIARLARRMHDAGCFHQDLYLCHFFVSERDIESVPQSWAGRVTLIDFHRLTRRKFWSFWSRSKDLAQLLYSSSVLGVTLRDRARFWRSYCDEMENSWLQRVVVWKASRYALHNAGRSQTAKPRAV